MSLKAVELQVALPRTQEIGRQQEQQQQKAMHEQLISIADRTQLDEQQRQRTADINKSENNRIKEREEKQKRQKHQAAHAKQQQKSAAQQEKGERSLMHDPLRGRHIDLLL